jgi:hypothetical protein
MNPPASFPRRLGEGWALVGWATAVVVGAAGLAMAGAEPGDAAIRAAIRATATTSLAFLLAAFVASSLVALWTTAFTKWLLRNRRYVGLSFAFSQLAHLVVIGLLLARDPEAFQARVRIVTLVGGSFGYVVTLAMTVTSFDRPTAWLGRKRWRILHGFGVYYLWFLFAVTYVGRIGSPRYALLISALIVALGVRVAAALKRRKRRTRSPQLR